MSPNKSKIRGEKAKSGGGGRGGGEDGGGGGGRGRAAGFDGDNGDEKNTEVVKGSMGRGVAAQKCVSPRELQARLQALLP